MLIRRHFLGDRGESEADIQQSENELHGEMETTNEGNENDVQEEEVNDDDDDDEPPPLEDIDEPEVENEIIKPETENKIIEPVTDTVTIEKPKEDDIGRFYDH